MSDDLDDLLRRAMKTLDDQVPSGYFEDLANQTLLRLEDSSIMQTDDADPREPAAPAAPAASVAPVAAAGKPVAAPVRRSDDDSGLHDIRNLASSQRMRISSKRSSQNPIVTDDELLASTTGSWKSVALPEPAKMVSLPELTEIPTAREVKEAEKAARRIEKERISKEKIERASGQIAAVVAVAVDSAASAPPAPAEVAAPRVETAAAAVEAPVTPIAAARAKPRPAPAKPAGGSKKNALIAVGGIAVAAAAGVAIYVSTQKEAKQAPAPAPTVARAETEMPTLNRAPVVAPAPAPTVEPIAADSSAGSGAAAPAPVEVAVEKPRAAKDAAPPAKTKGIGKMVPNVVDEKPEGKKPDKKEEPGAKKDPSDPDFNKLLKEAGYEDKKQGGPALAKKALSGDDMKKGMNGVAGAAAACYAGQQGTASVKLTVAPSGQVTKVTVSGVFAGTPVGACVEAAVRGASFPAWDGGPASVNYSYLLSE